MLEFDLQKVGISVFEGASVLSLVLLIVKGLSKEIESTLTACFQAWRRLEIEFRKLRKRRKGPKK